MQKLIENGFVAVIHSCDWGTPWATWHPQTMFDRGFIQLFLDWRGLPKGSIEALKAEDRAYQYLHDNHPDVIFRGFEGLAVTWLVEGQEFLVREYDGIEAIVLKEEIQWKVA
jgi:hypothetical protein